MSATVWSDQVAERLHLPVALPEDLRAGPEAMRAKRTDVLEEIDQERAALEAHTITVDLGRPPMPSHREYTFG